MTHIVDHVAWIGPLRRGKKREMKFLLFNVSLFRWIVDQTALTDLIAGYLRVSDLRATLKLARIDRETAF